MSHAMPARRLRLVASRCLARASDRLKQDATVVISLVYGVCGISTCSRNSYMYRSTGVHVSKPSYLFSRGDGGSHGRQPQPLPQPPFAVLVRSSRSICSSGEKLDSNRRIH